MNRNDLKYSVCVDMLYTHLPMAERIQKAKASGASAIECWGWARHDLAEMQQVAGDLGLGFAAVCLDSRDEDLSPKISCLLADGKLDDLRRVISESAEVMHQYGIPSAILLAGEKRPDISLEQQMMQLLEGLEVAAEAAQQQDITLVLEPLNQLDHAGAFLSHSEIAFSLMERVNNPHMRVLYDIYHQQISEGNLIPTIRQNVQWIGHFHMADTPGRHEPGTGEINYANVLDAIAGLPYHGYIGLEYQPTQPDMGALDFLKV